MHHVVHCDEDVVLIRYYSLEEELETRENLKSYSVEINFSMDVSMLVTVLSM